MKEDYLTYFGINKPHYYEVFKAHLFLNVIHQVLNLPCTYFRLSIYTGNIKLEVLQKRQCSQTPALRFQKLCEFIIVIIVPEIYVTFKLIQNKN